MSEIISDEVKKVWPKSAPSISNINKYVEKYKNEVIVIKYGGNVLIDREVFNNFIVDIGILHKLGLSIIVVHGGGPRIKRELDKSNISSKFIKGLRVTDKKIINIVENVLIDFNKDIVNSLKLQGSNATSIHTKEKNIISVKPEDEELGFVGIPEKINMYILNELIKKKEIPVIAPLGIGKDNQSYNINGDTAAGAIAKSLKSRRLLLMTNVEGVYDNNKKLISELCVNEEFVSGTYKGNPDLAQFDLKLGYTAADFIQMLALININVVGIEPKKDILFEQSGTLDSVISSIASYYGYFWFIDPKTMTIKFVNTVALILKDEKSLGPDLVAHNLKRLQNFAWWTYEYGLIKNNGEADKFRRINNDIKYEIYGSGIISSYDEVMNVIKCSKGESERSKFLPYNIEEIAMTCFDYSEIQDRYYVIDSMDHLYESFKRDQDIFWFEG